MRLHWSYYKHTLDFRFVAGTSRGTLNTHTIYIISVQDMDRPQHVGLGEVAPLKGLSIDHVPDIWEQLGNLLNRLEGETWNEDLATLPQWLAQYVPAYLPAVRFGMETALHDLYYGGRGIIFPNSFTQGHQGIPINGLIWMGDRAFMLRQIEDKLAQGFGCIKMKIGAIDFDTECELLGMIRERFPAEQLVLRADANGAWSAEEAAKKLDRLAAYTLHSIEQPIKPGQWPALNRLCRNSPIPIALDEELIGVNDPVERQELLQAIQPQYIILKPTLLGGMAASAEWIREAEVLGIGWWLTSALESNVGLNAIAQFTAQYPIDKPHGLGTGQLYHNNFPSPLQIEKDVLWRRQ